MATKEDEKRFDPGFSNRSISVQDIYCSYPLIKDRQKIVVATTIYATTTMDKFATEEDEKLIRPTVFRIDRPSFLKGSVVSFN